MDQEGINLRIEYSAHRLLILCFCKFDLFSKDVILIPVNHSNSHWTAAAINFRKKRIYSYDSMGTARPEVHKVVPAPFFTPGLISLLSKALRKYLDDEHRTKKNQPFDFTGWVDWVDEVCPPQLNDGPRSHRFDLRTHRNRRTATTAEFSHVSSSKPYPEERKAISDSRRRTWFTCGEG